MDRASEQYAWMLGLMAAWRQQVDDDQDDSRPLMGGVYAKAGRFINAPSAAANDIPAALLVLLFIYLWNCAKYRAFFCVRTQNGAIFFQTCAPPFLPPHPAETRAIPAYPNCGANFFGSIAMCQMNTPLTGGSSVCSGLFATVA